MLVTPFWATQPWFPQLLELLIEHPRMRKPGKDLQLNRKLDIVGHGSLGDNYMRAALQGSGLSTTATTLICNAWREGTKQQYNSTLRRWGEFCCAQEIHPITPINDMVEFLSYLYDNGGRFGVITTAQSTLGNFIHVPGVPVLVNHPIQKMVKGAYNTRPPPPCSMIYVEKTKYITSIDLMSANE